ncbi:acryloyl-CoA reductase [Natribacillus halophilus]|uniref:Putative quinone oxidoreductase, YhdH/YhfP family n=1 Tax=Natribacillus halophilus TaxID=549003 RepID=A0A1G8PD68_9BACI|nr:acryloyl-CoA reductase [Natribacillus halophilus]SDI90276.1 putative quinone oxidoreductase, YhdH/YhfP family [Natribacillus halophilus]
MSFHALVAEKVNDNVQVNVKTLTEDDLPEGDVLIRVHYSSVNYKDGLATLAKGNVVTGYPIVSGIDLAGVIEDSQDNRYQAGQEVIVTTYDLGVSQHGGYSEYARVPADWVVPMPTGLDARSAMIYGTAGFTAASSVNQIEDGGIMPEDGEVLVTGASGGVGSLAVAMLAKRGFQVTASTGKKEAREELQALGVTKIVSREDVQPEKIRPLDKGRWAAVVDPVGGQTLAYALSTTKQHGIVALSGMTGGTLFKGNVFPFILRGVQLRGIETGYLNTEQRQHIWQRLSSDLYIQDKFTGMVHEYSLEQLPDAFDTILKAQMRGRAIVKM